MKHFLGSISPLFPGTALESALKPNEISVTAFDYQEQAKNTASGGYHHDSIISSSLAAVTIVNGFQESFGRGQDGLSFAG